MKEMKANDYKELLYQQFALIGKAVSNNKRLEILDLLCQGERTVEDLAHETETSVSSISQHLQVLKNAHLLESRKEGLYVFYHLADEAVGEFWRTLRALAVGRSAILREAIQGFVESKDEFEPIDHDVLVQRAKRGDVIVIDVRPKVEFQAGHITHALSIPVTDLETHLRDLPKDREIVAYCRGPYCLMSYDAVNVLRQHGYKARRLADGFPEWQAGGKPTETGADNGMPTDSKGGTPA